jgi:predicted RNA-binding protein with PUA-like domain
MAYWLVKSDPEGYSYFDLLRDKKTEWTGVRNYAARIHLNAMQRGDDVLVYHSNTDKAVMGNASVSKSAFPDLTTEDDGWVAVELKAGKSFRTPVTLDAMKKEPRLANIGLIKIGRLSVMPLTEVEYTIICEMGK